MNCAWRGAVSDLIHPKFGKAKWQDINGNADRDRPATCCVCSESIGGPLQIGEAVEVWLGNNTSWQEASVVCECAPDMKGDYVVSTTPNNGLVKEIPKKESCIRRLQTPNSRNANLLEQEDKLEGLQQILSKREFVALVAALPQSAEILHLPAIMTTTSPTLPLLVLLPLGVW